MFNRFIYRREWSFPAFIVKRFRVFRAPLHRSRQKSSRCCSAARR
ncbi:hypothetical protein ABLN67_03920 [Mycobacterium tuberculosis]